MTFIKKSFLTAILAVILTPAAIFSQVYYGTDARTKIHSAEMIRMEAGISNPTFIKFSESEQPCLKDLGTWLNTNLKMSPKMGYVLLSTEHDLIGMSHYRYQQTFDGIPVNDGIFILHKMSVYI